MPSNRELIESIYDAFARGDAGTVFGAMHPEVEWKEAEGSPYADQNPYVGAARVGEGVIGRLMADFEGFTVTPLKIVAEGDTVVALGRYTGTHRRSSTRLDAQFAHAWTLRDGKVTGFQQYTDTAQYQRLMTA
jgi:ketosteroid isomerase-like protein